MPFPPFVRRYVKAVPESLEADPTRRLESFEPARNAPRGPGADGGCIDSVIPSRQTPMLRGYQISVELVKNCSNVIKSHLKAPLKQLDYALIKHTHHSSRTGKTEQTY